MRWILAVDDSLGKNIVAACGVAARKPVAGETSRFFFSANIFDLKKKRGKKWLTE